MTDLAEKFISSGKQFVTDADLTFGSSERRATTLARIRRLREKKRLFTPTKGFHVFVPDTYLKFGVVPAEQYINQMMEYLGLQYYVGLLSAAMIHGSSHQKPMVFQVCVEKKLGDIKLGDHHVQFIQSKDIEWIPASTHTTSTGTIVVSSKESTVYDLVRYVSYSGGISNVATNIYELLEEETPKSSFLDSEKYKINILQRVGHILDKLGLEVFSENLWQNISKRELKWTPLIKSTSTKNSVKDKKWMILANEEIEADI